MLYVQTPAPARATLPSLHRSTPLPVHAAMLAYHRGRPSWDIRRRHRTQQALQARLPADIAVRPKHAGIIAAVESDAIVSERAQRIPVKAEASCTEGIHFLPSGQLDQVCSCE